MAPDVRASAGQTSMKATLKKYLGSRTRRRLSDARRRLHYLKETIVGGGPLRERILVRLLRHHYASLFRRQWGLGGEEPHFFSHRLGLFQFTYGEQAVGPFAYYRGFFNSELVREGDRLLDIGCGDAFFTKRFLSAKCAHIDAIDIEPEAIETARKQNPARNIDYHLLDAVAQPFPAEEYDVIIWDGALGHFPADTTQTMIQKIASSLTTGGIFLGSESLGVEGSDHLQFFHSLDDMAALFTPYFKTVALREVSYPIGDGNLVRREAFWRCANDEGRLQASHWKMYSSEAGSRTMVDKDLSKQQSAAGYSA